MRVSRHCLPVSTGNQGRQRVSPFDMQLKAFSAGRRALALRFALLALSGGAFVNAGGDAAAIAPFTSLRIVNGRLTATVDTPPGIHRVTLQSRTQLPTGTWIPRAVQWANTNGDTLKFELPMDATTGWVRVVEDSDADLPLPLSFYTGLSAFAPNPAQASLESMSGPGVITTTATGAGAAPNNPAASGTPATVVESDIWHIDGNTLYFFNQDRALQVIDIANPKAPALIGWLPVAGWGEQMYELPAAGTNGDVWLALLASPSCLDDNDQVLLVKVSHGQPSLAGALSAPGQIQDSRLVGNLLYLACSTWQTTADTNGVTSYQSESALASFDLSNPANPLPKSSLTIPGYSQALAATEGYLLAAGTTYGSNSATPTNKITIFDISNPDGVITPIGAVVTAGSLSSKFDMAIANGVLAAVSTDGYGKNTYFETFSLSGPGSFQRAGQTTLVSGQSLFAARFDGTRAYVITYEVVDPLWIIDWSDPANPHVAGKLEAPGYATYLQPEGDRLLALGDDGWRTMVELFDVADPARPALLSEAVLGQGWSWSNASYDDKAFQVYADANLLLVPWQGQSSTNIWFTGVQLIDWKNDALTARGVVQNGAVAQRSTLIGESVLALSSDDLVSADISNRDAPSVSANLSLIWQADWVRSLGEHVLEVDGTISFAARLATKEAPRTTVATAPLPALPVVGVEVANGLAYVLQMASPTWTNVPLISTNRVVVGPGYRTNEVTVTNWVSAANPAPGALTVLNLASNRIDVAGQIAFTNASGFMGSECAAAWPNTNLLVWAPAYQPQVGFFPLAPGMVQASSGSGVLSAGGVTANYLNSGNGFLLLPFNVEAPTAPAALAPVALATNEWSGAEGGRFATAGKIFAGHSQIHLQTISNVVSGMTCHYLDVVDFTDPIKPATRAPVAIPGVLTGVAVGGALIYTVGADPFTGAGWTNYLQALAYDGVGVSLAASLPITDVSIGFRPPWWPIFGGPVALEPVYFGWSQIQGPVVENDGTVWLVRQGISSNAAPTVESWTVTPAGEFAKTGAVDLATPPSNYHAFGNVLVVAEGSTFEFVDLSAPTNPTILGEAAYPCALTWDWTTADAERLPAFWTPRGGSGVWRSAAAGK